jgi:hypothetical protein
VTTNASGRPALDVAPRETPRRSARPTWFGECLGVVPCPSGLSASARSAHFLVAASTAVAKPAPGFKTVTVNSPTPTSPALVVTFKAMHLGKNAPTTYELTGDRVSVYVCPDGRFLDISGPIWENGSGGHPYGSWPPRGTFIADKRGQLTASLIAEPSHRSYGRSKLATRIGSARMEAPPCSSSTSSTGSF